VTHVQDTASEVAAAARLRSEWAEFATVLPRNLETIIFRVLHGPAAALDAAATVLPSTDEVRERVQRFLEGYRADIVAGMAEQTALAKQSPTPAVVARALEVENALVRRREAERLLATALSGPWVPVEEVRRGIRAVTAAALPLLAQLVANDLAERLENVRQEAGRVVNLLDAFTRTARNAEIVSGDRLLSWSWSEDDVRALRAVAALPEIRTEQRPAPAIVAA
jgi:hypothetical protein